MMFLLTILGFWACCCLNNIYGILALVIVFGIFLIIRFKKITILLLWIFLCALSMLLQPVYTEAKEGIYRIVEIKQNYCLASNDETTIVLYNVENPNYYDEYYVSSFENVHSIHNIHQFSFQEYLNNKNIYQQADTAYLKNQSSSMRSKLYSLLYNSKNASYYLSSFYGIYDEECPEIFTRLSIPLLTTLYLMEKGLKKILPDMVAGLICLFISIAFGYVFTYKISLIRYILFKIGKLFFEEWEHSFSFSLFLFLCLNYTYATDFSLVFPVSIQLLNHYIESNRKKKILTYIVLMTCQFYYFHEVDFVFTMLFSLLRTWNTILFITSICIPPLLSVFTGLSFTLPSISFHYVPDLIFFILVFCMMYYTFKSKKQAFLLLPVLCIYPLFHMYIDPFFHVYMLDIGQGDCTLIVEPFQKSVILIDCGQNLYRDNVTQIMIPVFEDLQIDHIDYLILTHDDYDHSGGKDELVELINVNEIIDSRDQTVDVDYPFYSLLVDRESDEENDESIVNYFSYDSLTYLWTGDASTNIESQLLEQYNVDVDVLKLGHHGSSTSSSYTFLETTSPKLGLISVGYENKYGHPAASVVSNCHELGIHVLETKDVGMIHIFTWRQFSFVECANGIVSTF